MQMWRIFKRGRVLTVAIFMHKNGDTNDTVLFSPRLSSMPLSFSLCTACKIGVLLSRLELFKTWFHLLLRIQFMPLVIVIGKFIRSSWYSFYTSEWLSLWRDVEMIAIGKVGWNIIIFSLFK